MHTLTYAHTHICTYSHAFLFILTAFGFGGIHFRTLTDYYFAFRGIGEYLLLGSHCNKLTIQSRFSHFQTSTASVCSAIVIKQGNSLPIQIEAQGNNLVLCIGNKTTVLPQSSTAYIVTNNEVLSDINNDNFTSNDSSLDLALIRRENSGEVIVTTSSGASIRVGLQMTNVLHLAFELSVSFESCIEGMLKGDASFGLGVSNILNISIAEQMSLHQFGLQCK